MDKEKSGKLIKEARMQKNYTQSELGNLLGVSNKAVSRWETGESFPDVGILENLASILGVSIQDIITGDKTGDKEEKENSVVTELVRVASLQQREKRRKLVTDILMIIVLVCCSISGYSAMGTERIILVDDSTTGYLILMAVSFLIVFLIGIAGDNVADNNNCKLEKNMKIVAFVLLILTLAIGFGEFLMICNDAIPFKIEKMKVGPIINGQLIAIFIANIIFCICEMYMYEKRIISICFGWILSVASMYLLVLYGDLLHRVNSTQGLIESLVLRSFVVLAVLAAFLICTNILIKKRK